jgi:hypothetical protein
MDANRGREWTRIGKISRKDAKAQRLRRNSREKAQKAQKKTEDEPRMDPPSSRRRGTMAGKLQIYADKTRIRIAAKEHKERREDE